MQRFVNKHLLNEMHEIIDAHFIFGAVFMAIVVITVAIYH